MTPALLCSASSNCIEGARSTVPLRGPLPGPATAAKTPRQPGRERRDIIARGRLRITDDRHGTDLLHISDVGGVRAVQQHGATSTASIASRAAFAPTDAL
jgi:hypothetical protein